MRLNANLPALGDVYYFEVNQHSSRVVYIADQQFDDIGDLYSVPIAGGPLTHLSSAMPSGGSVGGLRLSPDGARAVYSVHVGATGLSQLYSVPITGGQAAFLSANLPANSSVVEFVLAPDSSRVIYRVYREEPEDVSELYSVAISGGQSVKLNPDLTPEGRFYFFRPTPDSSRVIYSAEQEAGTGAGLYSVPVAGGAPTRLNGPLVTNGNVLNFRISPDSATVVYYADQEISGSFAVFATYEVPPSVSLIGPVEPLATAEHGLNVSLSAPKVLGGAQVTLRATSGDAVAGTDYLLSASPPVAGGSSDTVVLNFAPGQAGKPVVITVLSNPQRTSARSVTLSLVEPSGTILGNPDSIVLTILPGVISGPPVQQRVYLPLLAR